MVLVQRLYWHHTRGIRVDCPISRYARRALCCQHPSALLAQRVWNLVQPLSLDPLYQATAVYSMGLFLCWFMQNFLGCRPRPQCHDKFTFRMFAPGSSLAQQVSMARDLHLRFGNHNFQFPQHASRLIVRSLDDYRYQAGAFRIGVPGTLKPQY